MFACGHSSEMKLCQISSYFKAVWTKKKNNNLEIHYHSTHLQWFLCSEQSIYFLKHAQDWKQKRSNVLAICCSALNCGIQNDPPDIDGWAQCVLWLRLSHKQEVIFKFYLIHLHPGVCCDSPGE